MAVAYASTRPAPAFDRRGIALLSTAHVFNDANQSVLPVLIPWLVAHRGLTLTGAATLVLAMNLSSSIVQPLFGYWSDRRSIAWVIPIALVVATGGTAAIGFAPNMPSMVLAALVAGIGIAAFHPEASRFANYFGGPQRATAMSWFTTGGYMGFALGPIVVTPTLVLFGLRGTAFLLVPALLLAALLTRDLPRFAAAREAAQGLGKRRLGKNDWRGFGILAGTVSLRSMVFVAAVTFTPVFAVSVLHVEKAWGSMALAALLLGGAAGTLWGGRLADAIGARRVVVVSLIATTLLGGVIAACGAWFPQFAALVPLLVAFGLALGLSAGVVVLMGQEYLPQRIGIASGLTLGLSVTIGGLAAPLFGALGDRHGLTSVFAAASVLAAISLVVALFLPPLGKEAVSAEEAGT